MKFKAVLEEEKKEVDTLKDTRATKTLQRGSQWAAVCQQRRDVQKPTLPEP